MDPSLGGFSLHVGFSSYPSLLERPQLAGIRIRIAPESLPDREFWSGVSDRLNRGPTEDADNGPPAETQVCRITYSEVGPVHRFTMSESELSTIVKVSHLTYS